MYVDSAWQLLLGWGTTFWELRVLSKMLTLFVNRATGVGELRVLSIMPSFS